MNCWNRIVHCCLVFFFAYHDFKEPWICVTDGVRMKPIVEYSIARCVFEEDYLIVKKDVTWSIIFRLKSMHYHSVFEGCQSSTCGKRVLIPVWIEKALSAEVVPCKCDAFHNHWSVYDLAVDKEQLHHTLEVLVNYVIPEIVQYVVRPYLEYVLSPVDWDLISKVEEHGDVSQYFQLD
jgi:hypothetical protein